MAQITKMESQVDVKSSAERFYQIFRNKQYDLPKLCPNLIIDVQLITGDWESVGSTRKWVFAPVVCINETGWSSVYKVEFHLGMATISFAYGDSPSSECHILKVESMDDKSRSVTCKIIDGELKKLYNSYTFIIQAIDKGDGSGSVMKTTVECEKKNEAVPDPSKYFDFAAICYKTIDVYFTNNA